MAKAQKRVCKKMHTDSKPNNDRNTIGEKVDNTIEDRLTDDTMYGEIIPSLMGWISPENQEERTNRLMEISEEITALKKKRK
ncbi:MAG: hypothetical protein GXW90_09815 [Tepidanaerobacter acetatoxydans]|uniref:hypothetical protein n=1 Tax=Tepidanaerobacter TaxID=499228 RepID=UPI000B214312|nr:MULTISPECIES: hypothetical protein [Tepidanaerobacter]NLU11204.1 hypothetical protein [Tepidanaerobacter acetatoxydans]